MKMIMSAPPKIVALIPASMESFPNKGPTVRSSSMRMGAGRAPERNAKASFDASSYVNCPLIWA